MVTRPLLAAVVNLDSPGRYLHWSIFTISEANLVLIAVMVVIFGVALTIPFPHGRGSRSAPSEGSPDADAAVSTPRHAGTSADDLGDDADADMWTSRLRRRALSALPPGKLLPDRQPAYVASWIYVFGVATLAALGLAIVSGFAIALGGTDWWHTNPVGHFFNSLHLWSVEAFMAFMVIHLWGKFWMAAWRGRRALTWVTGVVAFVASVVECFTGYLSQQNFDSQWISTSGKDAFNAVGVGAFFNLMNFGQMLLWHVVLIPIVLVALVGAHVLAVRVRGVVHPLPVHPVRGRAARRAAAAADAAAWRGPTRRYDIVKEATVATVVALILVVALAGLLSSPDVPPVTVASWAKVAPADFMATAASELAGTSETATYGPPYNNGTGSIQRILFSPQTIVGVRQPLDAAQTFVLAPLSRGRPHRSNPRRCPRPLPARLSVDPGCVEHRLLEGRHPCHLPKRQSLRARGSRRTRAGHAGAPRLTLARSGAIDADLLANHAFYGTDFTKPLLFLEDGQYFSDAGDRPAPHGHAVGRDERDRELPRPALALALHPVVPGTRLRQLRQRRPHRHLPHRASPRSSCWPCPSSRDSVTSPPRPRPPARLARTGTNTAARAATPKDDHRCDVTDGAEPVAVGEAEHTFGHDGNRLSNRRHRPNL